MKKDENRENIFNIPNFITLFRVVVSIVLFYLIFTGFRVFYIILVFTIGMISDALDGQIARRLNLTTEFGRRFDVIADRILMMTAVFAVLVKFNFQRALTFLQTTQIFLIISREITVFPFLLMIFVFCGKKIPIPKVRFIGKTTTVMQAIAFPLVLLDIEYNIYPFSFYFSLATALIGFVSAIYYIKDTKPLI